MTWRFDKRKQEAAVLDVIAQTRQQALEEALVLIEGNMAWPAMACEGLRQRIWSMKVARKKVLDTGERASL